MNRSVKELLAGGRNAPAGSQHRRGRSLTPMSKESDENLDLFSKNRRTLSVASSDESDVSVKLGRLSVGSVKLVKSGLDDLLSSTDGGKHDYDWLLTPPGTPIFPSSDGNEPHQIRGPPRSTSLLKTGSTAKTSRLSVTQSESNHSTTRPIRSSSATRPAVSSTQYSTYSSNKSSSILNTSSASVSSYIRPSSPVTRSPIVRPSTPTARPTASRPTTPSRTRPSPTISSIEKTRPSQISRPSTPTSRPKIPANLTSPAARPSSRPSTPTRRIPTPSSSPATSISGSVGRVPLNGRVSAPVSRPSSPGPRVRSPSQPVVLPDFSLDAPPNLRTTLPDRPLSAGRSRPGPVANGKGNTENPTSGNLPRRQSSPITTRGRVTESSGRGHGHVNGHANDMPDSRRAPPVSELTTRKLVKTSSAAAVSDSNGFGRNISKKSLDMAIRHMDIRNGTGGARPVSGTTLFPQSIRPTAHKNQNGSRASSAPSSLNSNGSLPIYSNGFISENGHSFFNRSPENEKNARVNAITSHVDIYESSRYDAILLKEDLKNTNWLHSVDDRSDPGLIFDHGFESLPEPFSPL